MCERVLNAYDKLSRMESYVFYPKGVRNSKLKISEYDIVVKQISEVSLELSDIYAINVF